jgi:hypothetical protein
MGEFLAGRRGKVRRGGQVSGPLEIKGGKAPKGGETLAADEAPPASINQPLHTSELIIVSFVTAPFEFTLKVIVALIIQLSSDFDPFR